jgi:cell division protein FtsN
MLKFIFFCLVIANVLLFALGRGYFASPLSETHQPQRLYQQQNSSLLKVISADVATAPVVVPAPAPAEPAKPEILACLSWGAFQTADINSVEAKLKTLTFGNRQSRQNVQDVANNIVFIPPLGSKDAADKKALELTHLGVRDFYIIQDQSNLRWGISLGVFKTEEAAKQFLASLATKGVHSAKVGVRTVATNKVNYVFKNVTGAEKASLDQFKTTFPAQELSVCK